MGRGNPQNLRRGHPEGQVPPEFARHVGKIQEHLAAKRARVDAEEAELDRVGEEVRADPEADMTDFAVALARVATKTLQIAERRGGPLKREETDTLRETRAVLDQVNEYRRANKAALEARTFLEELDARIAGALDRLGLEARPMADPEAVPA